MEFSKVATEMNTRIENGEQETVEIELDHGEIVNCAIMIVLTVNDKDYIVLLPLDKNGQNHDGNVWFYEFIWDGSDKEPELGFIIGVPWQRKGYAYEVCSAILKYAKEELDFEKVISFVMEENKASIALCEKLGFLKCGDAALGKESYILFCKVL